MTTPLLERLLHEHPDAKVDVVVGGRAAELFAGLPQLGRLMTLKKEKRHRHYRTLKQELAKEHYDILIDFRTPFFRYMVSHDLCLMPKRLKNAHKVSAIDPMWPSQRPLTQKVWIEERTAEVIAKEAKKCAHPLVVIGPTANWAGKQWPQKNFAKLIMRLKEEPQYVQATFALLGAPNEREAISDLIDFCSQNLPQSKFLDLVGKTTIAESYAWIDNADLFIGHDSGLSHMAAAAGTPSLTLFGPMNDALYAPWSPVSKSVTPPTRLWKNVNLTRKKYLPRVITDISVDSVMLQLAPQNETTP